MGSEYQVFLSFRGPDTRQGFTDVLYHALVDAGVRVFRDDEEVRPGEKLLEILRAIGSSIVCIPIFSKGYADSKWCLLELAEMIEKGKKIMPVFYNVTPDDVKLKTDLYKNALSRHDNKNDKEKWKWVLKEAVEISGWDSSNLKEEDALKKVTKLKGWQLGSTGYGKLCKLIVEEVLKDLKVKERIVTGDLVGMDEQLQIMLSYLSVEAPGVRFVVIHGIGGCGKTTLAGTVFNSVLARFQACSFLANIRESSKVGLKNLQGKLTHDLLPKDPGNISDTNDGIKVLQRACANKKVLIVLDDVDEKEQIEKLAGSSSWYSSGSRIIITTRDIRVLGVDHKEMAMGNGMKSKELWTFEVKEMSFDNALQLFSKRAFKMEYPPSDFLDLSKEVVSVIGRLPLALEIVGSQLCGKRKEVWEHNRSSLVMISHKDIRQTLMTSYKALDFLTKQIFLDIACLPVNIDKEKAICMWRSCGFRPELGMKELISMSMVKETDNGKLWMHDHLRDLGKEIVSMENLMDFGKRSRLWNHQEALAMLKREERMRKVEALQLALSSNASLGINGLTRDNFKRLANLRFLQMHGIKITGDFENQFTKLRWLSWHSCPSNFTAYNLDLQKLAILDLSNSEVTENWEGWNKIKVGDDFKILDLSSCRITKMPDLSRYRDLERLILHGCSELTTIENSIRNLKCLQHLNLELCSSLQGSFLEEICSLESLVELFLSWGNWTSSKNTIQLPESIGNMKSLEVLCLHGISIGILPDTIGRLSCLRRLSLRFCWIENLPEALGDLHSLVELDLKAPSQNCFLLRNPYRILKLPALLGNAKSLTSLDISNMKIEELPDSIGNLENLKRLDMSESGVRTLPRSIGRLRKLEELYAQSSGLKGKLPTELGMLSSLRILNLSYTEVSLLPSTINELSSLTDLRLEECNRLQELPSPPGNLTSLRVISRGIQRIQKLPNLNNLKSMVLDCGLSSQYTTTGFIMKKKATFLGDVSWIWDHSISNNLIFCVLHMKTLPDELLGNISNLRYLFLGCPDLQSIPPLPSTLSHLTLMYLSQETNLPCISNLKNLSQLMLLGCCMMKDGFETLELKGLEQLEMLALMWITSELEKGLQLPGSLQMLHLYCCPHLEKLYDLSSLKNLKELNIEWCDALAELPGLDGVKSLEKLSLIRCTSLKSLGLHIPGSSKDTRESSGTPLHMNLQELNIKECNQLEEISGLGELESLQTLCITYCHLLKDIGPQLPAFLKNLQIHSCDCLRKFPDVSNLKNLHKFYLMSGDPTVEIPGVEELKKIRNIRSHIWL